MAKIVNRRRQPFTLLNFFIFIGREEEKSFVPHPTSCELICTHNNRKEEANDIITSHILCLESETYYSARHGAVWCAGRDNNKRKKRKKKKPHDTSSWWWADDWLFPFSRRENLHNFQLIYFHEDVADVCQPTSSCLNNKKDREKITDGTIWRQSINNNKTKIYLDDWLLLIE